MRPDYPAPASHRTTHFHRGAGAMGLNHDSFHRQHGHRGKASGLTHYHIGPWTAHSRRHAATRDAGQFPPPMTKCKQERNHHIIGHGVWDMDHGFRHA
ncbi:hypothetical protein [Novacetimonas hansenii]|uniref:hypothetical protein n=1 Tax=Novacetimonas hansenii TaxID=436 RepID=UPI000B0C8262|nr:hypothetical protein [Novacetimonas hansenii]